MFESLDPGQIIFLIGLYVGLCAWMAKEFQLVANTKGYSSNKYFWICLILPLAGWILVAALPQQKER